MILSQSYRCLANNPSCQPENRKQKTYLFLPEIPTLPHPPPQTNILPLPYLSFFSLPSFFTLRVPTSHPPPPFPIVSITPPSIPSRPASYHHTRLRCHPPRRFSLHLGLPVHRLRFHLRPRLPRRPHVGAYWQHRSALGRSVGRSVRHGHDMPRYAASFQGDDNGRYVRR